MHGTLARVRNQSKESMCGVRMVGKSLEKSHASFNDLCGTVMAPYIFFRYLVLRLVRHETDASQGLGTQIFGSVIFTSRRYPARSNQIPANPNHSASPCNRIHLRSRQPWQTSSIFLHQPGYQVPALCNAVPYIHPRRTGSYVCGSGCHSCSASMGFPHCLLASIRRRCQLSQNPRICA